MGEISQKGSHHPVLTPWGHPKALSLQELAQKYKCENNVNSCYIKKFSSSSHPGIFQTLHHLILEKEMATHSSIPAQRIPWTEEPGGPQSMGRTELDTTERLALDSETEALLSLSAHTSHTILPLTLAPFV